MSFPLSGSGGIGSGGGGSAGNLSTPDQMFIKQLASYVGYKVSGGIATSAQVTELSDRVTVLELSSGGSSSQVTQLLSRLDAVEDAVDQIDTSGIVSGYQAADTTLSNSITALTTRVTTLENSTTTSEAVEQLNQRVYDLEVEAANTTTDVGTLVTSLSSLQTTVNTNTSDITALNTRATTIEGVNTAQTSLINAHTGQISTLSTNYTTLSNSVTALQTADTTANTSITALQTRMTAAETNITTLTSNVSNQLNGLTTVSDYIEVLDTSVTALTTRVAAVESENATQETSITTLDTRLTALESNTGGSQAAAITALQEFDARISDIAQVYTTAVDTAGTTTVVNCTGVGGIQELFTLIADDMLKLKLARLSEYTMWRARKVRQFFNTYIDQPFMAINFRHGLPSSGLSSYMANTSGTGYTGVKLLTTPTDHTCVVLVNNPIFLNIYALVSSIANASDGSTTNVQIDQRATFNELMITDNMFQSVLDPDGTQLTYTSWETLLAEEGYERSKFMMVVSGHWAVYFSSQSGAQQTQTRFGMSQTSDGTVPPEITVSNISDYLVNAAGNYSSSNYSNSNSNAVCYRVGASGTRHAFAMTTVAFPAGYILNASGARLQFQFKYDMN